MRRLSELIRDLCPDGVEYRPLGQLFTTRNGYTPSKSDLSAWETTDVPWFRMEDIRENGGILNEALTCISASAVKGGRLFPANSILVATSATIGAHALITVPHLSNQRFTSLQLKEEYQDIFNYKFLYYYCFLLDEYCLKNTNVSSFASVGMKAFRSFRFPVVPLDVQQEIVRILDQFATLEAELEARRKQYEHYRNRLLSYETLAARGPVEMVKLGDVVEMCRGSGMPKASFVNSGVPALHYGHIFTAYGVSTQKARAYVSPHDAERLIKVFPGDLVIANTSENMGDVGKAVVWEGSEKAVTGGHATVVSSTVLSSSFLSHYVRTSHFSTQKRMYAYGTKVIELSAAKLAKIVVPLPSLDEQRRIADVLNRFDALVNNISTGLPAEIAARRKQYEHYRDRLLSFPEKEA